jgi:hypothetical protein
LKQGNRNARGKIHPVSGQSGSSRADSGRRLAPHAARPRPGGGGGGDGWIERERSIDGDGTVSEDEGIVIEIKVDLKVVTERVRAMTGIRGQESAHAAFVRVLKGPDTEVFV